LLLNVRVPFISRASPLFLVPFISLSDEGEPLLAFPEDGGFTMHFGGNNVVFDDLHVEAHKHFDSASMTYHPQRMLSWSEVRAAGPDSKTPTKQ